MTEFNDDDKSSSDAGDTQSKNMEQDATDENSETPE